MDSTQKINNNAVYGVEIYSQNSITPGFVLTFTGEEIKQIMQALKTVKFKRAGRDSNENV